MQHLCTYFTFYEKYYLTYSYKRYYYIFICRINSIDCIQEYQNTGILTKPPHDFSKLWIWLYMGGIFITQARTRVGKLLRPCVDSCDDKK